MIVPDPMTLRQIVTADDPSTVHSPSGTADGARFRDRRETICWPYQADRCQSSIQTLPAAYHLANHLRIQEGRSNPGMVG